MHSFAGIWPGVATTKPLCYSCKSAAATLFCRHDSAFLCLRCDAQIHTLSGTRHPRVWLCEVCEQAPATISCNADADAAALCSACDADIHSVNPLARRHDRSSVQPFYDSPPSASTAASVFKFLPSQHQHDAIHPDLKAEDIFFSDMDSLVDFDYPIPGDGVVPDQSNPGIESTTAPPTDSSTGNFCRFDFDATSYPSQNLSHSVSSSSLDVGVVPDRNTSSDASYPAGQTAIPAVEKPVQLRGMDREARVLRYREKKKNRKFEKTIRYASRKAYAEIRPRIKGRFVKRSEVNSEIERIFAGAGAGFLLSEGQYGVVPSL